MRTYVFPIALRHWRLWLLYALWIWFGLGVSVPQVYANSNVNANIDTNEPNYEHKLGPLLSFNQGAVMLNPYTIKKINGVFEIESEGGGEARYFGEIEFRRRYAWFDRERKESKKPLKSLQRGDWPFDLDWEARLGYAAKDKDASGATIVGSGDWYGEISCGYPRPATNEFSDGNIRMSVNFPEVLFSLVTDRGAQDIHDSLAFGTALVLGGLTSIEEGNKKRKWECILGLYYGWMDTPDLQQGRIVKQSRGYPEFETTDATTVRLDFRLPVGKTGHLIVGSRFYLGFEDLNPWTVQIGYSASLDTLKALLESL